jgi:glycosyltransferase involved in cell wall biosynthesis
MRVALDVTPLIGPRTGIGEFVSGLAAELARRPDVTVVPVAMTWRGRQQAGAQHQPIPARLVQQLWLRTERAPITSWLGSVDVVHGTNYVVGPRDRRGTPRIVTVHDLATVKTPHLCDAPTLVFPQLVQRAVATGAMVQTDSDAVACDVREWLGIGTDRVKRIHPGVPPLGEPVPEGLDHRLAGRPFVLSVGTEDPRKGLTVLAAAFGAIRREIPELQWVHAGAAGWGTEALVASLAGLDGGDLRAVHRVGRVTPAQRSWLLRHTQVLAYPSMDEGFGFPPLEALSVGTPVVATDVGSLPEVLGNMATIVPPSDPDKLAAAVIGALNAASPPGLQAARIARAQHFSFVRMADEQIQWYRTLADLR